MSEIEIDCYYSVWLLIRKATPSKSYHGTIDRLARNIQQYLVSSHSTLTFIAVLSGMALPTSTNEYFFPSRGDYIHLKRRETPLAALSATDVLVKIHATSLQYRDFMIAKEVYPATVKPDLVPLSDMAGEVIAVGEKIHSWKVGDRVCANFCADHVYGPVTPDIIASSHGGPVDGVLTEYKIFQAHSLVAIPEHLSYEEASGLPCAAVTAYNSLNGPVPVKAGDSVLVLGTGGVSIFGLQFAVAAGATVIVTSSSDDKLKIATKLGAKHVINYSKTPNWDEEVLKLTNGLGVDHVLEVGGAGTMEKSLNAAKTGGNISIIGALAGSGSTSQSLISTLLWKSLTTRGIVIGSVAQFNAMNRLLSASPETTRPLIDKVFAFDQVVQAFEYLESQKHVGKIVIKVSKD